MSFEQLLQRYETGKTIGAIVDSPELGSEIRQIAKRSRNEYFYTCDTSPHFSDKASHLDHLADKEGLALPFVPMLKQFGGDNLADVQVTGDCYAHSTRGAIDVTRFNEEGEFIDTSATCLIYALRGRRGEGMTAYEVLRAVKNGGILLTKKYDFADLREYEDYWRLGADIWPSRGVPPAALAEARDYRINEQAIISTMEEARAALFSGRTISCGSSINPSRIRNDIGISYLQNRPIAHAMHICGVDTTKTYTNQNIYVWDNSWPANYFSGGEFPWKEKLNIPMPACYFCLSENDTWRAIKAKGAIVVSGIDGFPEIDIELPDLGTIGRL